MERSKSYETPSGDSRNDGNNGRSRASERGIPCATIWLLVETLRAPRRSELIGSTLRRLVRRGARSHISNLLSKTRPEDVAFQFPGLTPAEQMTVFRILMEDYPEAAGEVLLELEPPQPENILEDLTPQQIAQVLDAMSVDDAVSLVDSLPEALREKLVEIVERRQLEEVQTHLTYGDETAGRLMDSSYLAFDERQTVREVIGLIQTSKELDNIIYLYVIDSHGHLMGVLSVRQLLLSPPEKRLEEVMTRSVIKVHTDTDQEEVAQLASRYSLLAIPVSDDSNRLVGIVTLDDLIDVVKEEATEDFFKMVGTSDAELVHPDRSFKVAGIRLPWLLVNLAGLVAAGLLIKLFEPTLKEALFLVFFMPVVMGMGGNIGSQTSTIAVRGLATGSILMGQGKVGQFLWRQTKVGAILALACATIVCLGSLFLEGGNLAYAAVVGTSLFLAILLASVNGAMIPLIFQRLGIDPAVASGPLVTTSNDITGILIYFGLASALIEVLVH